MRSTGQNIMSRRNYINHEHDNENEERKESNHLNIQPPINIRPKTTNTISIYSKVQGNNLVASPLSSSNYHSSRFQQHNSKLSSRRIRKHTNTRTEKLQWKEAKNAKEKF